MEISIDILNELKSISFLLAEMQKINVFTVPAGYFDTISDDVLAILREENKELPDVGFSDKVTNLPTGYFDQLAGSIMAKIKALETGSAADELRSLSPMLSGIQNKNVFEVPQGYFETLAENTLAAIQPQQAKIIVMRKRSTVFMKYAVAAAFTGMMALGVFKFTNPVASENKLDAVVLNGLQINKEHSFDQELAKVSDEDIIRYLQANGENVDAQTVASQTLDEKELPTQSDYLTDDKALDKYLDNVNINDLKN
jgi:hypothetical protein